MASERHIRLELPNSSLVNCFGIEPTLVKGEVPERISLFSLGRYTKWRDNATTNNVYYTPKLYTGTDAKIAFDKAISNKIVELYSLNVLLQTSLHVKLNKSLSYLRENKDALRYTLLYYSELLKYKNRLNKGNFFITSDDKVFENIKFAAKQLNKYNKYKVPSEWLEENLIIIGAKGCMNFDNPIIASPFIDYKNYQQFLKERGIDDRYETKLVGSGSSWPIMAKMRKHYDNYQLYLNEKMPLKWHFEKFLYPEMFYITLHLND